MTSASEVMDSVNKYRHGVLIGNFVEDEFGKDLHEKGPQPDAPKITTTHDHHDLNHSLYRTNPSISSLPSEKTHFYVTAKSCRQDSYKRPEEESSYKIFYHKQNMANVPVIPVAENNPKKEQRLQNEGRLYDHNKFNWKQAVEKSEIEANEILAQTNGLKNNSLHGDLTLKDQEQIPDILTGQIFKAKPTANSELKPEQKGKTKIQSHTNPKTVNPYSTYSFIKPQIIKFEEVQYQKFVYPNPVGQERDILFGHGIEVHDFQKRGVTTTYDLSHNQKIPTSVQINSLYEPDLSKNARQFHRQTFYEKNHQQKIPVYGTNKLLGQEKAGRPYQPYTNTFDYSHLKKQYLRK